MLQYQITIPSFGVWGYNMAFAQPGGELGPLPHGLATLSETVFEAAKVFPCDISRMDGLVANSIFDPNLYEEYTYDQKQAPQSRLGTCRDALTTG